jgi:HD domain
VHVATATVQIPDTKLAKEAHDILRECSTELLYNHSNRVFLFAAQQGRQGKIAFDPELLYVSAAFHDLGLLSEYSSETERFEVDGANAVRQFLIAHDIPEEKAQTAWEAIALHTTPGVTQYMRPEVALLFTGVGLDVVGLGLDDFPADLRQEIVEAYPRTGFKTGINQAFFDGFAHKPGSTWGTVMAHVCERYIPAYASPNLCDLIDNFTFPDSGLLGGE